MNKLTLWLLSLFLFSYSFGGTISLAWNPVEDPGLQGYRVHYGTASGIYDQIQDVGNVTSCTLQNLSECTRYYIVVTSYDTSGNESAFSNEVNALPKPRIISLSPSAAEQGTTITVTIDGYNYENGATVRTSNPGITISSTTFLSCTRVTSTIIIAGAAPIGLCDVDVVNPNGTYGRALLSFEVIPATVPEVIMTFPSDGSTGIPVSVHPEITFDEELDPASVSQSTIILLDENSVTVPQAVNSPFLDSSGSTVSITPINNLNYGEVYKIKVVGGGNGIKDLDGNPMNSDFIQNNGFTTVADVTPPVISNVASLNIAATSADIAWNTDEPADSMVKYRVSGASSYAQTTLDPALVTSHTIHLTGLDPDTLYYYHAISKDSSGNSSLSLPDSSFTTSISLFSYIRIEAEEGEIQSPMQISSNSDPPAFQDAYIFTPQGSDSGGGGNPSGKALYDFYIPAAGSYTLWVRMYAVDTLHSSLWAQVNSGTASFISTSQIGSWEWEEGQTYMLSEGLNHLELGSDEQVRADRILFTNDPSFMPVESPTADRIAPASVLSFNASPGDGQNILSWVNPPDPDFKKTIVRFRDDGVYPKHPEDGFPVCARAGNPSASDSSLHTGLANGTMYYYSAFAVDGDGNISNENVTSMEPQSGSTPGQVRNNRRKDVISLFVLGSSSSEAGTILIEWDPPMTGEVAGYKVYFGTSSAHYQWSLDAGQTTSATLSDLEDCTHYYWAVKAYNPSGQESKDFSNEISGMPRPWIDAVAPGWADQGELVELSVSGANFSLGASLESEDPGIHTVTATQLSCYEMVVTIQIEPQSRGVKPAHIGSGDFTIINPDMVFGTKKDAFVVTLNESRLDIDMSGRIDGLDLNRLALHFGSREGDGRYDPDCDFDGDGWIDGNDLSYLSAYFGQSY